jgi:alkylhydroperoxidase/carboxymuconolactone decarboxylase family protein YurZ
MADDVPLPSVLNALQIPDEIRPDMLDLIRKTGGEVWNRDGIPAAQRSMVTIAILAALNRPDELRVHIPFGLDNGLTRAEICEVIMHTAVYAGFPAAVGAFRIATEVFAARD